MAGFVAEDFRSLVDKLNEFMTILPEEDKKSTDDSSADDSAVDDNDEASPEDIDDLLTKPAGLEKLVNNINPDKLIKMLSIPDDKVSSFKSGINMLKQDKPRLSADQAMAFAIAFDHALNLDDADVFSIEESDESIDDEIDAETISMDDLVKLITEIAEKSPTVRLHSIKIIKNLVKGMKGKQIEGGINNVITLMAASLEAANAGKLGNSLENISKMVSRVEGDDHALDGDAFAHMVVELLLLVDELSKTSKD